MEEQGRVISFHLGTKKNSVRLNVCDRASDSTLTSGQKATTCHTNAFWPKISGKSVLGFIDLKNCGSFKSSGIQRLVIL